MKHPGLLAGVRVIDLTSMVSWIWTPGRVAGPAPRLGAHTAEIMNELDDSSPTDPGRRP
jgi:crotonobetainyl-CoA:carnitine CoA-transferase CaiB-like acyl-CoA transferase